MATWRQEFFGPGLDAYDPFDRRRSPIGPPLPPVTQLPAPAPAAPPLAPLPPIAEPIVDAGPSRGEQAARLAQDIAYGRSDWERAGQAVLGSGQYEDASGLRRAGAVAGGVALGTLALASWIPGFNIFKPAQAARAARAFGQGAAQGARAGTGIVRGGLDEAAALEQARRAAAQPRRAQDISRQVETEFRTGQFNYTMPRERVASISDYKRESAEIFHRQGFDVLPQRTPRDRFVRLTSDTDNYIPLYRGLEDAPAWTGGVRSGTTPASSLVNQFYSGDLFIGSGIYGHGTHMTPIRAEAAAYAGNIDANLIEAVLPRSARILRNQTEEYTRLMAEFEASDIWRFNDLLASKGYDAFEINPMNWVVLNRGALIVPGA